MFQIVGSSGFSQWLRDHGVSLAVSTYQAGKLLLIGTDAEAHLKVLERTFSRCMGLWSDSQTLWMSTQYQLWRLENMLSQGESSDGFDRLFVPQVAFTTGDIDIHDVSVDAAKRPLFVNTLFNCLATVSERESFVPIWYPPFITRLAAQDRCHLNGLANQQGEPRYVTACSVSDRAEGWRQHRGDGGVVIDVRSDQVVAEGLSMPHSPRLDADPGSSDRLWLLNSGTGHLGFVDLRSGQFEPVAFCHGYARGLDFVGRYAVAGLSRPRTRSRSFTDLAVNATLQRHAIEPRCGVQVIDLERGTTAEWLTIEGDSVQELYDVVVLRNTLRPGALGLKSDEICRNTWLRERGQLHRWSADQSGDQPGEPSVER